MTDLAKLASEITPGPWMVESLDAGGCPLRIVRTNDHAIMVGSISVGITDTEPLANATAMALVPELIAEVLRLREATVDALKTVMHHHETMLAIGKCPDPTTLIELTATLDILRETSGETVSKIVEIILEATK